MAPSERYRSPFRFLLVTAACLLALSVVPHSALGSTPPLLPELTLSVSDDTILADDGMTISVAWHREGSVYPPPGVIQVTLYSVSDEKVIGTYPLSSDAVEEPDDTTRHYSGVIRVSDLPRGGLIVTAIDPISGADYSDLQHRRFSGSLLIGVALLLAFGLIVVPGLLLRRR